MTSFIKRLLTRRSQIPKLAAEILSDAEACALGEGWVEVIKEEILAVFDRRGNILGDRGEHAANIHSYFYCKWEKEEMERRGIVIFHAPSFLPDEFLPEEDWRLIQSRAFRKNLESFDRAMGNKVFAALEELTKNPIECRGNTIKRLKGSKKHMWRYRIGDYRLLYIPLKEVAQVLLVTFSHRSKVYAEKA